MLRTATMVAIVISVFYYSSVAHAVALTDVEARYQLTGDSSDSSGNGYNGVDTSITYVADGTRGTVASFNGTTSSINVSSTGLTYSFGDTPNGEFSTAFWILPGGVSGDANVIMGGSSPGRGVVEIVGSGSWGGMGGGSANGGVGVNSGGGGGKTGNIAAIDLNDGAWHHVLLQWAGDPNTDIEAWIDGNAAPTFGNGYNGNSDATTAIRLGGPAVGSNGGAANDYYTGLMSDVMFFNRQILGNEVDTIMRGDFGGGTTVVPEPASIAIWSILGLCLAGYGYRRRRNS